jgi:hypothetical protein
MRGIRKKVRKVDRRRSVSMVGALLLLLAGLGSAAMLTRPSGAAVMVISTSPPLTIGSVTCNAPQYNPTHFAIMRNVTYNCSISDPNLVVNGDVNVYIQSSDFGNQTVTGTGSTATHTITFTYTGAVSGCNTTVITYDKTADGGNGGVQSTGAGFAFVNSDGQEIVCGETTTTVPTTTTGSTTTVTVPVTTTVTLPTTTTVPVTTTVTNPGTTTTVPETTSTVTSTVTTPGTTTTTPGTTSTVTSTVTTPGQTQTTTVPGPTQTVTVTTPGQTQTVTKTVTVKTPGKTKVVVKKKIVVHVKKVPVKPKPVTAPPTQGFTK